MCCATKIKSSLQTRPLFLKTALISSVGLACLVLSLSAARGFGFITMLEPMCTKFELVMFMILPKAKMILCCKLAIYCKRATYHCAVFVLFLIVMVLVLHQSSGLEYTRHSLDLL